MANYSVANSTVGGFGGVKVATTTTYITLCAVAASSQALGTNGGLLSRGKVYDILVGTAGTPADNYMEYRLQRATMSTSGTGWAGSLSSVSSAIVGDQADGTVSGFLGVNSSNEANVTLASAPAMWYVGVNQRASYRWVAAPGSEFVYPATSSNGLVLQTQSGGYTSFTTGNILVSE